MKAAPFFNFLKRIQQHSSLLMPQLLRQVCFLCGDSSDKVICSACMEDLPWQGAACPICAYPMPAVMRCGQCLSHPPSFDRATAVFTYDFPIDRLIAAAKYHRNMALLKWLGRTVAERIHIETWPDVLIPVPLHASGLSCRGYNQALEIAKQISRIRQIPLDFNSCRCVGKKQAQAHLSTHERIRNVKGVYQVSAIPSHWRRIALIDDVMTTGATLNELARVYRQAGISFVEAWCCARNHLG